MKRDSLAALEFGTQEGNLCFRQGKFALALRLLPMVGAPIIDGIWLWGPPRQVFAHESLLLNVILAIGVTFQIGYTAWVLRDRLLPYVVDAQAGVLRRGQRPVCALADIEGVGVVVYHGKGNNTSYIAAALRGQRRPCKLLMLLTSRSAYVGAQELAQLLNVPLLAETNEGIWWK